MKNINIQADKLSLISWISQLQDEELIEKLKEIQQDNIEIPEWQKSRVRKRIKESDKDPSRLLDWDKVKHNIKF